MVEFKKTKYGWVAVFYYSGYDDEMHAAMSPAFRTQTEAERYAIEEMGAIKCMFCNHAARNHFNAFGNNLIFNSGWMQGDYYTCDACIPKVKEDIVYQREEREKRLEEKYGKKSNQLKQSRQKKKTTKKASR
jgi:hypothetical protein